MVLANVLGEGRQDLHRCIKAGLHVKKHVVANHPVDQTQQALLHHVFSPLQKCWSISNDDTMMIAIKMPRGESANKHQSRGGPNYTHGAKRRGTEVERGL